MTFRNKKFGKYVVCDELYNLLLCVIKINFFNVHHISNKIIFMLPIPSRGVQKVESRASLTWTRKKMSTLTSLQGFFVFIQFFVLKNTLKNSQNGFCNGHFWYTLVCFHPIFMAFDI
jgi:hypothetical protein